ncbi:MAG: putative sensor protein [Frankiales bacterium]|nr:putative sensor protein [Frankiales bacterium]
MTGRLDPTSVLPDDEPVLSTALLALNPESSSVRDARAFVLTRCPPLSREAHDVIALLTSELVTNAVIHARTPLEVGLVVTSRHVLVTVFDHDRHKPPERTGREGGWGLGLVRSLSGGSGLTQHPDGGKTAWFRVRREPPQPVARG